jgi:outer membrane usher protein
MLIRPCAPRNKFCHLQFRVLVLLGVVFCTHLLFPSLTIANETIIVTLTLNQQKKGDFFVIFKDDGDFLIRTADLEGAGFSRLPADRIDVEGDPHVSLRALQGVDFHFDEATLILELTAAPELLPKATLDLAPQRRQGIIYPRDTSLFLNYGIDYSAGGDDEFLFEGLTLTNELGVRIRDLLLLTDTLYTESPDDSQFVRLNTSLTWDDRQSLRRGIAGDFFTFSGNLGSRVQMGGLSLSKLYRIDPYFIRYPLFDFSGMASLPSDVELYVDGVRVRSERFAPGEFELQQFSEHRRRPDHRGDRPRLLSAGNSGLRLPFYFTDQIPATAALHEYSYNRGPVAARLRPGEQQLFGPGFFRLSSLRS